MTKLEFTNKVIDNLNNSMALNGKINLEKFIDLTNKQYEAINYARCCDKLKYKTTQTFDEFITGVCKNRGITLINNYTKETIVLDSLIKKWKANNI